MFIVLGYQLDQYKHKKKGEKMVKYVAYNKMYFKGKSVGNAYPNLYRNTKKEAIRDGKKENVKDNRRISKEGYRVEFVGVKKRIRPI